MKELLDYGGYVMKVKFTCYDCRQEHKNGELIGEIDGIHDYVSCKCDNGHKAKVFPQTPLYVYLLEHALDAYADEFCYESYVSAYSSLENLFRITAKAVLWGTNQKTGLSLVKDAEKIATYHQSERCLGLFLQISIQYFGEEIVPFLQDFNSEVQIRNKIMHGGLLPSQADAKRVIIILNHLRSFVEAKMTYTPFSRSPLGRDPEFGLIQDFSALSKISKQQLSPEFKKFVKEKGSDPYSSPLSNDIYKFPYNDSSLHLWISSSLFSSTDDRYKAFEDQNNMTFEELLKKRKPINQ